MVFVDSSYTMIFKIIRVLFILFFAAFLCGCSGDSSSSELAGYYQTGTATFRSAEFHGLLLASGEKYDKNALTGAHRELAFGSWVEVTNLENGRRATVRINHRLDEVTESLIEVSEKAASDLGMKISGRAEVTLKIVAGP
ncbi:MAG: septal ring lytic transglycosylase RlpA family lipoprotein [Erysipelotrichia bacterium]|nr:septal ring lytic transglycosylase RlpA family lipoprotein [Erysipelotrichia bacterium]